MQSPMFTLIIPTLYRHDLLFQAINSACTRHPWRLCIIDNQNLGWSVSKSWNEGIHRAFDRDHSRYAIVSNDDVLYHPECLDAMVTEAKKGALFVGCKHLSNHLDLGSVVTQGGFSLFLITRECIERAGWFDEHFGFAYYEDNDYYRRMNLAGFSDTLALGSGFFHYGSQTINMSKEIARESAAKFDRNQRFYVTKWGGLPGKETFDSPFGDPAINFRSTDYIAPGLETKVLPSS